MTQARATLMYSMFVMMLVLAALDQTILATALPAIARELHGQAQLSWVFSAYLMASTVVIPLYGKLADIYGSKPLLLTAIFLFLCGSLACGFSDSMTQLIVARGIHGAGGGGLLTLTMLGVLDLYPAHSRGKYQAQLGAAYGIATMFGPLLGGLLVEHYSWRWAFFINVPTAMVALAVLGIGFRGALVRHKHAIDYLGAGLLAAALVALLLATRRDADATTGGWTTWALVALSVKLTASFIWVERRASHPILPLSLFSKGVFSAATGISATTGVALFAAVVFLPVYLQTALLKSPTASAWHLLPLMTGITLAAMASSKVLRASGPVRAVALAACALMALSFGTLALIFRLAPNNALALSACVLPLGLGIGLLFPLVTMVSQRMAPLAQLGIATATPIMVRALGGAIGVSVLGSLLASQIAGQLGASATPGLTGRAAGQALGISHDMYAAAFAVAAQPVFWTVAAVCFLACLGTWVLPVRLPHQTPLVSTPRHL